MKRIAPSSSATASDTDKTDVVRSALLQEHDRLRKVIDRKHKNEILAFETQCQKDLNEPEDCLFVKRMRSTEIDATETTLKESDKEEKGKDNSKEDDAEDNGNDDNDDDDNVSISTMRKCSVCNAVAVASTEDNVELEQCWYCEITKEEYDYSASIKCATCSWSSNGGMACSRSDHGFCRSCVEDVKANPKQHDAIPQYHRGAYHLHPFHICDCGICAWCGDEVDDCCSDHFEQACSCYP